jgi:UDP-N-acetylglucosamine acyltransferase
MKIFIHHTSIVEPGAVLGSNTTIGPFCHVGPHVVMGHDCVLKSHVSIQGYTTMGNHNICYPFASLGADPQDKKYKGEQTLLVIGNNNVFRENVTVNTGTITGIGTTSIGDNNLLMAYTHIAHDCIVGNGNVVANGVQLAGHVVVGNHTILGGLSAVHQFCRIGDLALVAGGSMVSLDIPPYTMASGQPCYLVGGIHRVGLSRHKFSQDDIKTLAFLYQNFIVHKPIPYQNAIYQAIQSLNPADPAYAVSCLFLEFLQNTQRGVHVYKQNA